MKKQIAVLATIIAATGFTAFGQDWITIGTGSSRWVYDEFTTPGTGVTAGTGDVNVEVLWAVDGTSDPLGAGVATTGVTSEAGAASTIASMLSGGWTLAQDYNSGLGSAALGTVETTTEGTQNNKTGGQITPFNSGDTFEVSTTSTGATASDIQLIFIAFAGSSYSDATALGWSSAFENPIGTSEGDSNATSEQNLDSGFTAFGVAPVPEPTTLALAGLGGLSMLFLRRRKA